MKKSLIAAFALSAVLSTPALAENVLAGHEIAHLVVGNTVQGTYRECGEARMDFFELYNPDGTIDGKERPCNMAGNWDVYQGFWTVSEGQFCTNFGSGREGGCYKYVALPDATIKRIDTEAMLESNLVVLEGNPENL